MRHVEENPGSGPHSTVEPGHWRPYGAALTSDGVRFSMYAESGRQCAVRLFTRPGDLSADHPLEYQGDGEYAALVRDVGAGTLYKLIVDGQELPDPYARFLPFGVHGPAQVLASDYAWKHGSGVHRPLRDHVLYEVHIGTFTEAGTYEAAAEKLPELVDLGVTAIEVMPISSFPGARGWGYDGVAHFAPFPGYGTPNQLRAFIDEAHRLGQAVILDVVYNHFGPAGNYLRAYSDRYFSSRHRNAWGDAPDFCHPGMRRYVLSNALYWLDELRFDGLRLDAMHAIEDESERHVIRELADIVRELRPRKILIAEDERNDPGVVKRIGMDAVWADDFHHAVHVTLTGERDGYYSAYEPGAQTIADAINGGWLYVGQEYPPSGRPRGHAADDLPAEAFIYALQNHDQIGNRALGERLSSLVSPDAYAASSMLLLFLPMTPLLFMGQEWGATSPFQYFTDHEPELGHAVSAGRREEFKRFSIFADPERRAHIPDPQAPETFMRSRLRWEERTREPHARLHALYRDLLRFRSTDPVMRETGRREMRARTIGDVLIVARAGKSGRRELLVNFGHSPVRLADLPGLAPQKTALIASSPDADQRTYLPRHGAILFATE